MKQHCRLLLLFLLCIHVMCIQGICQSIIECEQSKREIRFIDLLDKENEPFHDINIGLSRLVMAEIEKGNMQALYIDYLLDGTPKKISLDEYYKRLTISTTKSDFEPSDQKIFPSDLNMIGFDQTIGKFNDKEFSQVHYVNFYACNNIRIKRDEQYFFSISWSDFIKLLSTNNKHLYSSNSYGSWWRGDIFVTKGYAVDKGTCGEFIQLAQSDSTFKAYNYNSPTKPYDISHFKEVSYKGYPFDLTLIEHYQKGIFEIDTIIVQTISDNDPYKSADQIAFAWNSFLLLATEKDWYKNSSVYRMSDAILLQKFHYSSSIPNKIISTNGLFVNGSTDSLFSKVFINSFYMPSPPVELDHLQTKVIEGVYLGDPHNTFLHKPEHDLVEIIYENILNGNLKAFNNDSLVTVLDPKQIRLNARKIIDIPEYEFDRKYKKGAIFSLNYQDSLTHNYEIQYYQVRKRFKSSLNLPAKEFTAKTVVYEIPIYKAVQLDVIELVQQVTFNSEGKNKQYHLKGIGMKVPADIDIRGVEYPIAYVRWEDLKKILLSDPRAMIVYQGKPTNLSDLIENRLFQSVFYQSGYIEPGE